MDHSTRSRRVSVKKSFTSRGISRSLDIRVDTVLELQYKHWVEMQFWQQTEVCIIDNFPNDFEKGLYWLFNDDAIKIFLKHIIFLMLCIMDWIALLANEGAENSKIVFTNALHCVITGVRARVIIRAVSYWSWDGLAQRAAFAQSTLYICLWSTLLDLSAVVKPRVSVGSAQSVRMLLHQECTIMEIKKACSEHKHNNEKNDDNNKEDALLLTYQ